MRTGLAAELQVLAHALNRLSESDRRSRDFTLEDLRQGLEEVVACFPVYRTYVSPAGHADVDREQIDSAIQRAKWRNPLIDPALFDFVRTCLIPPSSPERDGESDDRLTFALKFQQYTAPVQAKGCEDTAFYRHMPLVALNEVGGGPGQRLDPPGAFHAHNIEIQKSCHKIMSSTRWDRTVRMGMDADGVLSAVQFFPQVSASETGNPVFGMSNFTGKVTPAKISFKFPQNVEISNIKIYLYKDGFGEIQCTAGD